MHSKPNMLYAYIIWMFHAMIKDVGMNRGLEYGLKNISKVDEQ